MKKLLFIPISAIAFTSLLLTACGDTKMDNAMKAPSQSNTALASQKENMETEAGEADEKSEKNKNSEAKPASNVSVADAAAQTTKNLLAAFEGETTASAKYAAYSKKAESEGYHQIALLFKAASTAENIHANNHKAVLQETGTSVPAIKPEFVVKTTKENLQDAISGEAYEISTMYPEFLAAANTADNQLALISLNYAYKTEKKHKVLYDAALNALQNNTEKNLAAVFYVCPTCGNTYENKAPARCGISMTNGEKFIKISSL